MYSKREGLIPFEQEQRIGLDECCIADRVGQTDPGQIYHTDIGMKDRQIRGNHPLHGVNGDTERHLTHEVDGETAKRILHDS